MHINNQKLSLNIFYKTSSWNMILISNDFWHKIKMYNFDSYNVLLSIATNIAVLLMTASVLQGHDVQHNNPACSGHFRSFIWSRPAVNRFTDSFWFPHWTQRLSLTVCLSLIYELWRFNILLVLMEDETHKPLFWKLSPVRYLTKHFLLCNKSLKANV